MIEKPSLPSIVFEQTRPRSEPPTLGLEGGSATNPSFGDELQGAMSAVKGALQGADQTAAQGLVGGSSPHEVMLALTKADIAFRFFTQTRNKVVEAYQEVMRMQM